MVLSQVNFHTRSSGSGAMRKRRITHGLPVISLTEINRPSASHAMPMNPVTVTSTSVTTAAPETPGPSSNRPWLASRGGAPVCNFSSKARKIHDNDWTPSLRNTALEMLRRDYTANRARGPTASVLKTWKTMRRRMHDGNVPVYPFTPS